MNVYDFDNTILRGDSSARFFAFCLRRYPRMWTDIPARQDRFGVHRTKRGKLYLLSFCFPYLADNEQVDANEFMANGAIRKTLIENI